MEKLAEKHEGNNTNTLLSAVVIRANTPKEFDVTKHIATKFKRDNYDNFYTINLDGYYTYKGESADYIYSEPALLALSNMTVVEYNCRQRFV